MSDNSEIDLRVALIDSDYYTEKAIHAYLAWDRRTRALTDYSSLQDFWSALEGVEVTAYPDAIILDVNNVGERGDIRQSIRRFADKLPHATLVCLSHIDDLDLFYAAAAGGARAFLHKDDVRYHIASAVCLASQMDKDEFLYSPKMGEARRLLNHRRVSSPLVVKLPEPVQYPGLSKRVRQTIELYAIEGMPATLIANEMRLAKSTVQSYIKAAYKALDISADQHDDNFLADLPQRERAFMKLTALQDPRH